MTRHTGNSDWWRAPIGERREELVVDRVRHAQHVPRFSLRRLLVGLEVDPAERDAVAARMTVLTAHAEREGEAAHDVDESIARDVLREKLEILEFLGDLGAQSTWHE